MKKQTLSIAFASMMFASVAFMGCSKNYDADIDQLKADVAANQEAIKVLQSAMAKGLMVSKVESVTGGYKLTMSDGSILNIKHGETGIAGPKGEKGDPAVAPQMRVNAAKNWEMSIDDGATWVEVKDVDGNAIADAKTFVKDNITVSETGNIVIGGKITGYEFDITLPSIVLVPSYCMMIVAAPELSPDGEVLDVEMSYVPLMGYFDMWSVNSIISATSNKTFALKKTTLAAPQTIGGVAYEQGAELYSTAGLDVILNPSMIDAENIDFDFVAALEEGELYDMPISLVAKPSTKRISTITKSAETAVWNINLKSVDAVEDLRGNANNLALSAKNNYGKGVRTLSEYEFGITIANGSSAADPTLITPAPAHFNDGVVVDAPANAIATALRVADADKEKIAVFFENGKEVDIKAGEYADYVGSYIVLLKEDESGGGLRDVPSPTNDKTFTLTYDCIGENGEAASNANLAVTFVGNSTVSSVYIHDTPLLPTGTNEATVFTVSQDELLDQLFDDNTVDKQDFIDNGINFSVKMADNENPITVKFQKSGADVENPSKVSGFDAIKFSIPQTKFFAEGFTANQTANIVFQLQRNTPATYFLKFDIKFTLDGTLEVTKATYSGVTTMPNTDAGIDIDLTDITLYSGVDGNTEITTTGAVSEFTGIATKEGEPVKLRLTITDVEANTYVLERVGDAPQAEETSTITFTGIDAWGNEFTTGEVEVTIAAADPII